MNYFTRRFGLLIAAFILCIYQNPLSAQEFDRDAQLNSTKDSRQFLVAGTIAHKEKDYDEAVKEYEKVHLNDTNYEFALYEKGVSLMAAEQYEDAIRVNEKGMRLNGLLYQSFINNLGTCYSYLKEFENAEDVYAEGLERFPYSSNLQVNRASAMLKRSDPEGLEVLYETIQLNPFHSRAHLLLGRVCAEQGLHSQAALAYYFYLITEGSQSRGANYLLEFEEYYSGDLKVDEVEFEELPSLQEGFDKLDESLDEKVALNSKYDVPSRLKLSTIRQVYYVLDNLDDVNDEEGFFHDFYLPFYRELMNDEQFKGSSYHCAQSLIPINPKVGRIVRGGTNDGIRFRSWCADAFSELYKEHEVEIDGDLITVDFHYHSERLLGMGKMDEYEELQGDWIFYHNNGAKRSVGRFIDGNKTGKWEFYSRNGQLGAIYSFSEDEKNGPYKVFYNGSGTLFKEGRYRNGEQEGETRTYYQGGGINEIKHYSNGELSGKYKKHFKNGAVEYDLTFDEGKLSGPYKAYYENGKLYKEQTYDEGSLNGQQIIYYSNGEIASKTNYSNGMRDGEFKEYDKEGNLESEGRFVENVMVGENVLYHPNGKIKIRATFDEKGRETGQYEEFDEEGNITDLHIYKKGRLRSYQFFNETGKVISEGKKKGRYVEYHAVRTDRSKVTEGIYRKGERDGTWKYYNSANILISKLDYYRGIQTGKQKWYYANGDLRELTRMKFDKLEGLSERYYSGGTIRRRGFYQDGDRVGEWYSFNPLGKMTTRNYYNSDNIDGWQVYYTEQGKIDYKHFYSVGDLKGSVIYDSLENPMDTIWLNNGTGKYVQFYYNGDTAFIGNYANGQANGSFNWFHSGNNISSSGTYMNGKRHGNWTYFTRSGNKYLERNYENGLPVGQFKRYWSGTDQLSYTESYKYGKTDGLTKSFYPNGQIRSQYMYSDGELNGEARMYDFDGNLALVLNYVEGSVLTYTFPDESGELVKPIVVGKGEIDIEASYQTGNPSVRYTIEDQWKQGAYLFLSNDGDTIRYSEYEDHDREGLVKEFHQNGQLKSSEIYHKDEEHGTCFYYYNNGKVRKVSNYYMGDLFGPTTYYSASGELVKTVYYYNDEEVWRTATK